MGSFSLEVVSTQSKIDVNRRMNMEIQKWEYRLWKGHATAAYDENSIILEDASGHAAEMDPVFNEWGQMGWELVTSVPCGAEGLREYIFKRPRELPSDIVFTSDLKKTTEDNVPGGSA